MMLHKIKTDKSLVQKAYDVIKEAIIRMEIEPGEALTEETLVEQLGISRTPIRAALLKLSHEGLVDIYPGKGTYVAKISRKDMVDTLIVRETLEKLAAMLASNQCNVKMLPRMKDHLVKQQEAIKADDIYLFLEYDNQFHEQISKMSRNRTLEKQISYLKEKFNRFVILSRSLERRKEDVIIEHRQILEAIERGDAEEASRVMGFHINQVKNGIEEGLKLYYNHD